MADKQKKFPRQFYCRDGKGGWTKKSLWILMIENGKSWKDLLAFVKSRTVPNTALD